MAKDSKSGVYIYVPNNKYLIQKKALYLVAYYNLHNTELQSSLQSM